MMDRRRFLESGVGCVAGSQLLFSAGSGTAGSSGTPQSQDLRSQFPRLEHEVFLNAAGGTPQGLFAAAAMERYGDLWRLGPGEGRGEWFGDMMSQARSRFARLIGATPEEIALVHCTKAGEQVVLDGLPALAHGGNVVTNDLHFSGSLHNLEGLRRAGMDVRVVRARDWRVDPESMVEAMDEATALVTVSLVSNINGHREDVRRLADAVHRRGGYLYADIIQAAGIMPIDVGELGIDAAACSGYKWLYGPHGAGFLYLRRELQGSELVDRMFPGHVGFNYPPWVEQVDDRSGPMRYSPPQDASRYQPGHVSYLSYAALNAGLAFVEEVGVVNARNHAVELNSRLIENLDQRRYPVISPNPDLSPVLTFQVPEPDRLRERLDAAGVIVSLSGNRLRVSPAVYNNTDDIDHLIGVLTG